MLTANQKRLRGKYTRIAMIGGKWSTLLSVGVQSFHVVENATKAVSYTHLRAHETPEHLVCRLLLEKKKRHETQ